MNEKPGCRIASASTSAVSFGSPEKAAGDEVGPGGEGDHQRMERAHPGAARRQRSVKIRLRGRRGLALGHAVDAIVHHHICHVDVAAAGVQEMVAADRIAVAVTAGHHDGEIRPRHFQSGGQRERTAVHAVETIAIRVGRNPRRAADAGDDGDLFGWQTQSRRTRA